MKLRELLEGGQFADRGQGEYGGGIGPNWQRILQRMDEIIKQHGFSSQALMAASYPEVENWDNESPEEAQNEIMQMWLDQSRLSPHKQK